LKQANEDANGLREQLYNASEEWAEKNDHEHSKRISNKAFKDVEKAKGENDDELLIKSDRDEFEELLGTDKLRMVKVDGDWKICDSMFSFP